MFALLTSINNLGGMLSLQLGAYLMWWLDVTEVNFDNLWLLILLCNLF